ncbi:hypothetical protein X875_4890 [Mannheimia varigena USDA-ARS-USMARC-1388]|uniref:Uncharacterized protein n=1 Tax=Mannheimia varigena USDA-ARS-USMARC-1296 TaxID=1433287 RepID=W0QFU8_9PAST|nr:hypothetical protein X808_16190 [Mannheimia varigena USDA-ARS-USMARC-1296]AHG79110.1 hypothetical protein X875_4890 [Mannheimia varigena USDA-ARS-USMARC-1388]
MKRGALLNLVFIAISLLKIERSIARQAVFYLQNFAEI